LLFLTRDAFCNRSIEDRRVGEGEDSLPPYKSFSDLKRLGVAGSRPCQNSRGDESADGLKGDVWNGDESMLSCVFCTHQSVPSLGMSQKPRAIGGKFTLDGCGKLGEFLRISVGPSSDRGRGSFVGDNEGPF
jgi:hypothetical protein